MREMKRWSRLQQKGPAIKALALEALRLRQRRALWKKIGSGVLYANLPKIARLRQDRDVFTFGNVCDRRRDFPPRSASNL